MQISYLPYKEIDKKKWDECIQRSHNRMIYGFSFYLDLMAVNWDGLILNDYEAVMPLPWKKKLQVKYLYQPAFMQQGGIFSTLPIGPQTTKAFIDQASANFNFAEITLNYANDANSLDEKITRHARTNYVLQLNSYESLYKNYEAGFTKSLRRIQKFNIRYESSEDHASIIKLYEDLYGKRLPSFSHDDYKHIISVCDKLAKSKNVFTRLAYSPDEKLLAAVVLLRDDDRLYNLISCITADGKKLEANYLLYDKLLQEFSDQGILFDLEGSDVNGVAKFYKKMNPELQAYTFIKYNQLNPLLKIFKK